jgi:hypothetical protein
MLRCSSGGDPEISSIENAVRDNTFGSWASSSPAPGHLLATHVHLMRNNKLLVVGGSSYNCCFTWGHEEARTFTISSGLWSAKQPSPAPYGATKDAFCSGHTQDDQGRVIFQGGLLGYGTQNGNGINNSARFDYGTNTWTQLGAAANQWYPTLVAGVRGTFIFPGQPRNGDNIIRRMNYGTTIWTPTNLTHETKSTYPRVSLLPNGKMFIASPAAKPGTSNDRRNYFYDPPANTLTLAGTDVVPESGAGQLHEGNSWRGTGVLLPLVPSAGDYPSFKFALLNTSTPYVKELNSASPTWATMGTRASELGAPQRSFANATLLPTGQVLVTGGVQVTNNDGTAVRDAEVYDPVLNSWLVTKGTLGTGTTPLAARNYHGTAILLPDGRVWTGSGSQNERGSECDGSDDGCDGLADGIDENTEEKVEIFSPWYMGRSDRPVITSCPAKISTDGGSYNVGIGSSLGTNVGRVVLMRPGSVTHAFDTDQRQIRLDILSKSASTVTVASPYGAAAAPPGDYMLFALRQITTSGFQQWVPSVACWTRVEPQVVRHDILAANYQGVVDGLVAQGYRPVWVDGFEVSGGTRFNAIFTNTDVAWAARHNMDFNGYQTEFNTFVGQGYRLAHVDSYLVGGQVRYAAIWDQRPTSAWTAYHGATEAQHQANHASLSAQGYRPVVISTIVFNGARQYTALWDKAAVGSWFWSAGMTEAQYQTEFNNQVTAGRRPAHVNAFMEGGVPKIVAIWNQAPAGAWVARHGQTNAGFQTEYDSQMSYGLQARGAAGYETSGASRFVSLWTKK